MFSGIVEDLRIVKHVEKKKDFSRISVDLGKFSEDLKIGDSVSINGVCLTIVKLEFGIASFDVMKETLDKSNLGELIDGDNVNIERSLKIGGRMDGHFVLGHVDGTGNVVDKNVDEDNCVMWIELGEELEYGLIPKGSIGVDGISLTIADIKDNKFAIALIPHTLKITTLGQKKKGDKVNIEIDYLGKWISKIVKER